MKPHPLCVRFGEFVVDELEASLLRNGRKVKIERKPYLILCTLLERPRQLVRRDVLERRVWGEAGDDPAQAINTAVSKLRHSLSPYGRTYIESVREEGYRYNGPPLENMVAQPEQDGSGRDVSSAVAVGSLTEVRQYMRMGRNTKQDLKDIVNDPGISQRLLETDPPPDLFTCVGRSQVFTPAEDSAKDQPAVPGLSYNHFVQVGAVIFLHSAQRHTPALVGYHRVSRHLDPQFVHTQGWSILWGASYTHGVYRIPDTPMDRWMAAVENDPRQATTFIEGPDPLLLDLLDYKIHLPSRRVRIVPSGVVTNDQRKKNGEGRVYTQYVFRVDLEMATEDNDPDTYLRSLVANGIEVACLPEALMPHEVFRDKKGNNNFMDIVLWEALHDNGKTLRDGTARFVRGFELAERHN